MSAYKQFNSSDIIVSPLEVNKGYKFNIVPIISSSGGYGLITYGVNDYSSSFDRIDAEGYSNQIERYLGQKIRYGHPQNYETGTYTTFITQ